MSEIRIKIQNGKYGTEEVSGEYTAIGPVKKGTKGWFVTVPGREVGSAGKSARVLLSDMEAQGLKDSPLGIAFLSAVEAVEKAEAEFIHTPETDAASLQRMIEMFEVMNEMAWAMTEGHIKGLVVFGPPGVGKSYGIIDGFNQASLDREIEGRPLRHTVYSGFMTPVHLFKALWECQDAGQIAVFDDCDNILADPDSLNMVKTALDTTDTRWLCYNAESNMLKAEAIDNRFQFNGGIVFITNVDFDNARGKIHTHLQAVISRCHYLDLTIDTQRDKLLWLKEVTLNQGMLERKGCSRAEAEEIVAFVEENLDQMRELSLRIVLKLADLRKTDTVDGKYDWKAKARVTCMKRKTHSLLGRNFGDAKMKEFEAKQERENRKTTGGA